MPDLHQENLTREEAGARSAAISVSHYEVHADLPGCRRRRFHLPRRHTHHPPHTPTHTPTGDGVFLDYVGESVESLAINGEARSVDTHVGSARILLSGLSEGENVVDIRSHSRFSRSGEGMHRFVDPSDNQVYLYTQYEPADSRRVFPVFEQPDIKARFRFSLTGPVTWQLRSNSPETSRTSVSGHAAGLQGVGLVTSASPRPNR